jgi:hypothetical protein
LTSKPLEAREFSPSWNWLAGIDRSSFTQKSLLAFEAAGLVKFGMPMGSCCYLFVRAYALLPVDLSLTINWLDAFDPGFTWNALLPAERSLA